MFQMCRFPVVDGYFWRRVNIRKMQNIYSERYNFEVFFGHNLFLLSSVISKFRMQSWLRILLSPDSGLKSRIVCIVHELVPG